MIPHILFVDDDEAIRKTLSAYLKSKGMDVSTAESGEEAMRLMQGTSFNLVILDLNLGKESGLDILDHFKMLNPSLPVIIFTSNPARRHCSTAWRTSSRSGSRMATWPA